MRYQSRRGVELKRRHTQEGESEQGSSADESSLAGCIAAVNNLVCDTPTVELSRDRTALSGKFPEDELKARRELELRNMLNFDAVDLVEELPPGNHAYDMVWVDEWRGDLMRSRLSVRQFKAEGLRTTCLREHQTRFSSSILFVGQKQRVTRTSESLSSTFLWHSCTLEQMRKLM